MLIISHMIDVRMDGGEFEVTQHSLFRSMEVKIKLITQHSI